jgi:hypothetical protein
MPHSFDLFDTLIGRLHCHPDSIFYQVQNNFPYPGFVLFRTLAESQSNGTLRDIYRKFQALTGASDEEARALQDFEFQTELNQIFPIRENLTQVQHGDLIVSDTYYTSRQIRFILDRIGLNKKIHLYASPRGKSRGTIWDKIGKKHTILSHRGDSLRADLLSPQSKGIPAQHYTHSQLSAHEKSMAALGHEDLAYLMRALRLQNPYPPSSPQYALWNDQCQINLPLLIHASHFLDTFCQQKNKKRILFTSRDGCLWIQLFQKLYPDYESIYFHSSRYAYIYPTAHFIDYVRSLYTHDALIVDSHGSGISCTQFFTQHLQQCPIYLSIINSKKTQHAILRENQRHETIEKLNYDLVGTLYGMDESGPLRSPLEYDPQFVLPSHRCIELCVQLLSEYNLLSFDKRVIAWASAQARSPLAVDHYIDHAVHHVHLPQDQGMRHLHVLTRGQTYEPRLR